MLLELSIALTHLPGRLITTETVRLHVCVLPKIQPSLRNSFRLLKMEGASIMATVLAPLNIGPQMIGEGIIWKAVPTRLD